MNNIKLNLKRVKEGKALTMPLSVLNGQFKKAYFRKGTRQIMTMHKFCLICEREFTTKNSSLTCSPNCRKKYIKITTNEYRHTPRYKKMQRGYNRKFRNKHKKSTTLLGIGSPLKFVPKCEKKTKLQEKK